MNAPADPSLMNAALRSYVTTFPRRDLLQTFLESGGLQDVGRTITASLDAVLRTAENHLYDYPGGVPWDAAFEAEYRDLLQRHHPWLDADSLGRIFSFSHWLCWHEGLNRNPGA